MKNKKIILGFAMLFVVTALAFSQSAQGSQALNFNGWSTWGGLRATVQGNTVTLNGSVVTAGYNNASMNPNMRNRTIRLEFQNINTSVFSEDRLIKIIVNRDEEAIMPVNVSGLIFEEYVPSSYAWVEFVLPANFDGRLGFVFYAAELKDLRITATYR